MLKGVGATTLIITTFSIMTLGRQGLFVKPSMTDTEKNSPAIKLMVILLKVTFIYPLC